MTIQPSSRNTTLSENPNHTDKRTNVTYAQFEFGQAVRIENGCAVYDSMYLSNRGPKILSLKKDPKSIFYVLGLPDLWSRPTLANYRFVDAGGSFMITGGSAEGNFYLCDKTRAAYYQNWKKKYEVVHPVQNLWNYFSLGERLYYLHQRESFTEIYGQKVSTFTIKGDILSNPLFKTEKREIKLYWNNNSDQAFLFLAKNLYALEQQKDGSLVTKLLLEDFDLPSRNIKAIHFDKINKKIYLGSTTTGLYVVSKHQFETLTISEDKKPDIFFTQSQPNIFYSQIPYQDNAVLTSTGFIVGKDEQKKRIIDKRLKILERANPFDRRAITKDAKAQIWVKSNADIFQLSQDEKKIIRQWKFKNEVKAIHHGKDSQIWLGVANQGLYKMNPEDPGSTPQFFGTDSLKNITYLESLTEHELLVGTTTGLYSVNVSTKEYRLVEGTKGLSIKSFHIFDRENVWIAALQKGIMLLTGKKTLVTFPLDKNGYLASPHCVVNDGLGYLWIPTNRGLFQMNIHDLLRYAALNQAENANKLQAGASKPLRELFYMYHAMDEGFKTNEFNGSCQPCGVKLGNGYISLPSLNGLVWFRPEQISRYIPDGHIILDKAELNQQPIAVEGDTVRFPLNPENIKFHFSTAFFGNYNNLNLSYTLVKQGSDTELASWLPIDNKDFTVRYSSLNSGNYTLIVRKQDGFGINNFSTKRIHLVVPQVWYETTATIVLFAIILILALTFAVYFYNLHRLKAIRREKAELEKIVLSRTVSLKNALKELEKSKNHSDHQVHIMSRMLASITHDVQSPLKFIAIASGYISDMVQEQRYDDVSEAGTMISGLSHQIGNMLRDLLDYIKVQVYGKRMDFEEINLKKLIDLKIDLFQSVVERRGNHFTNELPDNIQVSSDYQLLSIVIHNLIDNAVKYTNQGEIKIFVRTGNNQTELIISNSGIGLAREKMELINLEPNGNEINHAINGERKTGLGLIIIKEVAELIGIRIKVTQTEVTSFHLFFNQ